VNGHEVYLDHFCFALGDEKFRVEDSVAAGRTRSAAAELLDAGFRYHHVAGEGTRAYDLARLAVEPIVDGLGRVDAIVYATCLPPSGNVANPGSFAASGDVKHLMDYPASRLQSDFGFDDAIVIGLNQQACTSMLGSLRLARSLLVAEPELQRVLCVTADRFPLGARYEQAYSLISDGAAGCVVSRVPAGFRMIASHHITNGALVHAGDDETVGVYFSYTHRLVTQLLARVGRVASDVAWVVPQNTNLKASRIMAQLLGIDFERVFCESMPEVAHVISGDNVVNLAQLAARGAVRPGDTVLLLMAGYGMNWQATLLEKV
jgi:3-oxoacyl-[acyl-carrier-protein] synthase III